MKTEMTLRLFEILLGATVRRTVEEVIKLKPTGFQFDQALNLYLDGWRVRSWENWTEAPFAPQQGISWAGPDGSEEAYLFPDGDDPGPGSDRLPSFLEDVTIRELLILMS